MIHCPKLHLTFGGHASYQNCKSEIEYATKGVVPHLVEAGLDILQYADDTLIFLEHEHEILPCIIIRSKHIFSYFHKKTYIFIRIRSYALARPRIMRCKYSHFLCKLGTYPFRYLGLWMHYRKLNNENNWRKDWKEVGKLKKKICSR